MLINHGDLKIVVPDHARRRSRQRRLPLTRRVIAGIAALRKRPDVGTREPLALLSEDGRMVVFEFRRRKRRAVVATVLGRGQWPDEETRIYPLAALV